MTPANVKELLAAACDERMTEAQWAELDALIKSDEAVRVRYLKQTQLEAHLRGMLRMRSGSSSLGDAERLKQAITTISEDGERSLHDAMILPALSEQFEAVEEERIEEEEPLVVSIEREEAGWAYRFRRSMCRMSPVHAAAAVLIAGVLIVLAVGRYPAGGTAPVNTPPATVIVAPPAALAQTLDAEWEGAPMATGESVENATLRLKSGLAKVAFPNGASVQLQGPAVLHVVGNTLVTLSEGRLTTHVPQSAIGFTVATPSASLVDLGTEVGVSVDSQHQVHAEVFTGKAAVTLRQAPGGAAAAANDRVLTPGTAIQVSSSSQMISEAAPEPLAFVRDGTMQAQLDAGANPFARWKAFSGALAEDSHLVAYYSFDAESRAAGKLLNRAERTKGENDGEISGATWEEGRFAEKAALRFDGSASRVRVNIAGKFRQATFATWVNIRQYPRPYGSLICTDDQVTPEIAHWVFSQKFAPMGLELSVLEPDAKTWIRDYHFPLGNLVNDLDRWHFFATCYDATHGTVRSWFDGKLAGEVKMSNPQEITVGSALIGCWHNNGNYYRGLIGKMDEMAIWDRSLSDAEIQAMYTAGAVH